MKLFVGVATILLLAVSCNQNGSPHSEGEPNSQRCADGSVIDGAGVCHKICGGDQDCDTGFVCDVMLQLCMAEVTQGRGGSEGIEGPGEEVGSEETGGEPPECAGLFDCPMGEYCDEGTCRGILTHLDGIIATCEDASDCGLLMLCEAGVCIGCLDDIQCAADQACTQGVCVREDLAGAVECLLSDCEENETCLWTTGECVPECVDDSVCAEGDLCLPALNVCAPEFGCFGESTCVGDLVCIEGLCVGCGADADCGPTEHCVASVCLPTLVSSGRGGIECVGGCGADALCDMETGTCYPKDGTCSDNADCPPDLTCTFALCTGCDSDGDCRAGQRCLFSACVPELEL